MGRTWAGCGLAIVAALLLAAPGARGQVPDRASPTAADIVDSREVEVSFDGWLDRLFADWPGLARLQGRARVEVLAVAARTDVHRVVRVRCDDAHLGDLALGLLKLDVFLPAGSARGTITGSLSGGAVDLSIEAEADVRLDVGAGRLAWGPGPISARVEAKNLDLRRVTNAFPAVALGGKADLEVRIDGPAEHPRVVASLAGTDVVWRGERVGAVAAAWTHAEGAPDAFHVRLGDDKDPTASAVLALPLAVDLRKGDLTWKDAEDARVEVVANGLTPRRMRPFWSAPSGADFRVDVSLKGAGTLDRFDLAGVLEGNLLPAGAAPVPVSATLALASGRQTLAFRLGDKLLDLAIETRIPLPAVRRQGSPLEPVTLSGSLVADLPLAIVAPFLPSVFDRPEGVLKGRADVGGTLGAPTVTGRFAGEKVRATLIPVNRRLEDVALSVSLAGSRLTLDALDARSGPGTLRSTGEATLVATPGGHKGGLWSAWKLDGAFRTTFLRFPLVQPDVPVSLMDGAIDVAVRAGPGTTEVDVTVSKARIDATKEKVPDARAIPTNPGVRVLDWLREVPAEGSALAGAGRFVLDLRLADPIPFAGRDLGVTTEGHVRVDRQGPVVRVDGALRLVPGGFMNMLATRFEIRGGSITLAEGRLDRPAGADTVDPDGSTGILPLDPVIDVVARGKAVRTDVLMKVSGSARRPDLLLASVPALPEYQILTLLILGRTDAMDDRNGKVRKEAAALVNRFNNPGLKRQLFDRLGIDKVGFGFGSSAKEPMVTVGKQITRELYAETLYHHNAPPGTNQVQGHVQYQVDPHWSVETTFGDRGEGGLGTFWSSTFGRRDASQPPGDDWGMTVAKPREDRDGDAIEDPFDLCQEQPGNLGGGEGDDGCVHRLPDEDRAPPQDDRGPRSIAGRIRPIAFVPNSARIAPSGLATLRSTAALLKDLPNSIVVVTGHSDDQGTEEGNRRVSLRRAQAARDRLRAAGVPATRIEVEAAGASRPLDSSGTQEARDRNRRVEVEIR